MAIVENSLVSESGSPVSVNVSNFSDPIFREAVSAAVTFPTNPSLIGAAPIAFDQLGNRAQLVASNSGYILERTGGVESALGDNRQNPTSAANVFDLSFQASRTLGAIDFIYEPNEVDLSTASFLRGRDSPLGIREIKYPNPFRVRIVNPSVAVNDTLGIDEDSVQAPLDVIANDLLNSATSFVVSTVEITRGGGVATLSADGQRILYSPSADL